MLRHHLDFLLPPLRYPRLGRGVPKNDQERQDLGTVQVKILSQNRPKMDEIGEKYGK